MKTRYTIIISITLCFACNNNKSNVKKSISWINDSLNIYDEALTQSGRWIDTTNTNMAYALYRGHTCILRHYFIDKKAKDDVKVFITNLPDGTVKIAPVDTSEYNGEYFIVRQGILKMYNKEGKAFAKATRLLDK